MEDLALVVGIMLVVALASTVIGLVLAGLAAVRRRSTLALVAHAVLIPGTVVAAMILDTMPGRTILAMAVVGHLVAGWILLRRHLPPNDLPSRP